MTSAELVRAPRVEKGWPDAIDPASEQVCRGLLVDTLGSATLEILVPIE